jgi:hypothetical protein
LGGFNSNTSVTAVLPPKQIAHNINIVRRTHRRRKIRVGSQSRRLTPR